MVPKSEITCSICSSAMLQERENWLRRCPACGFWTSLHKRKERLNDESIVDEAHRKSGLHPLRRENNRNILCRLQEIRKLKNTRVLDVGSAYGWFLEAASEFGADVVGVEPEEVIADVALCSGYKVWKGYFPDVIPSGERFDVIVFNDVLEHLPDPVSALKESWNILNNKGLLVVNLPVSTGILFRIASAASCLNFRLPLHRLWQVDYRSPHLSYFNAGNLGVLASNCGFRLVQSQRLSTVARRGIFSRLKMGGYSTPVSILILFALMPYILLHHLLPPDIKLFIFEKVDDSGKQN